MAFAASVRAQESSAGALLSVDAPDSCISESRVRERVQQYRGGAEVASELRVRVERRDGVLGFVILRSGEAVARRQLTQLSAACDEQLDSLAIAIAVALTNTSVGASTNASVPSPSLAATSGIEVATAHSKSVPSRPTSGQLSTDQARDVTGAEPADAHTARSVADQARTARAPRPAQPNDAHHPRRAEPEPSAAGFESLEAQASTAPVVARTRDASGAELQPSAARVDTRSAPASVPANVRDDGADDGLGLAHGSRAGDVGVMAGARYGLELLPGPLLLFDVGIEVGISRVVSLVAGGLVGPVKKTAADGGTMRAQVTGGELLLCARPTAANVMLRWCAGTAAASVAVRGEAFFVDRSTRLAWVAGLMRAAVRWPADSPVAAELAIGGHANLMRPRMRVLHSSEPDRVSWIFGGSLGLQVVVSLR